MSPQHLITPWPGSERGSKGSGHPRLPPAQSRRAWLRFAAALGLAVTAARTGAHDGLGPVTPPRAAPPLPLTLHDGRHTLLPALLQGRVTALQLMFTGCSATCPIQGAVFSELQGLLRKARMPRAQLLSVSIDPLGDDPRALAAWRQRFGAEALWLAGVPPLRHPAALPDFLRGNDTPGREQSSPDRHNTQVFLFDPQGRLAFRTADLAAPAIVAESMAMLASRS